jgi:hypothetical protein
MGQVDDRSASTEPPDSARVEVLETQEPASGERTTGSRNRPDRPRNAYEKQALIVSIAAFAAALLGAVFTGYQALYTQWTYDSDGPVLQIQPSLVTWVGTGYSNPEPLDSRHPETLPGQQAPDHHASILVRLQNAGREPTTIVDASFDVVPGGPVKAASLPSGNQVVTWCSKTGYNQPLQPPLAICAAALPYTLEPGTIYTITLQLDGYLSQMSSYAPNGFNLAIDAVGVSDAPVTTRLPLTVTS